MTGRGEQEEESAWRRYLRFVRPNPTGDVNTEIDFHLQSIVDELVAGGMSRAAAMDAAQRKFGDVSAISTTLYQLSQERERRMQWKEWADGARHDVVFGLRQLRKSPGFTFVTLLTLALGIGANSAIFSVFHAVLLRPLSYTNADRIMSLAEKYGASPMSVTYGNYGVWRATAKSFEVIGATTGSSPLTLTSAGDPAPIQTT